MQKFYREKVFLHEALLTRKYNYDNLVSMETKRGDANYDEKNQAIIIGKLMSISGILQREGNRLLLPYDLNQQQFSIFFEIAKAGEVQQKDMINRLRLEKAHVSKVVKKLQNMGLIKVVPLQEDKRSAILSPTEKGEKVIVECKNIFYKWRMERLGKFSGEELIQILGSVEKLQKAFSGE